MSWVRGLVDRLLLICAVVAGGLVPGFIAQYRQRLGGRLDQARLDLAPWQQLADRFFHGDIHRLIQYHLASRDPRFHAEGAVIGALVASVQHLQAQVTALHGGLFHQAGYLALHADPGLVRATLADWVPTFGLSAGGIAFALAFAALLWILFQSAWSITAFGLARLSTRSRRPSRPSPAQASPEARQARQARQLDPFR